MQQHRSCKAFIWNSDQNVLHFWKQYFFIPFINMQRYTSIRNHKIRDPPLKPKYANKQPDVNTDVSFAHLWLGHLRMIWMVISGINRSFVRVCVTVHMLSQKQKQKQVFCESMCYSTNQPLSSLTGSVFPDPHCCLLLASSLINKSFCRHCVREMWLGLRE